ncbi:MAG: WYL domain-containing protein [Lachnospiraceae bacterium]|nr:WYL domain-containing protein [Lachnospiraceae bacterium]
MPKGTKQKLKLYYLSQIMLRETDDNHGISMPQIQSRLLEYGITSDRKSVYDDLESLKVLGLDIIGEKVGKSYLYHVGKKQFEIAELKLLVDSIQSSKFITEKKSNELIKKLTNFASEYEAKELKRQVVVHGRVKTMNESIYYVVDDIHKAITTNSKIRFEYLKWNLQKKMVRKKDKIYEVSPWALTWNDENYYLVAYDSEAGAIKHYRVDKMRDIKLTGEKRDGRQFFKQSDIANYTKINFGMYGGEEVKVKLEIKNEIVGVLIDRFGTDISIKTSREGWSVTTVDVALSDQFFGWIFGLGTNVQIISPEEVRHKFASELAEIVKQYI